jgi:hypothetical protein
MKYQINLFDDNFYRPPDYKDLYANIYRPVPELEYLPRLMEWNGITVFTDTCCFDPAVDLVKTKYKIAWLIESKIIKPHIYNLFPEVEYKFDQIYTHHAELLKRGDKYRFFTLGGCWIPTVDCKIYDKLQRVMMIASHKNYAPGHVIRHRIAKLFGNFIDLWGSAYNKFDDKDRCNVHKNYMFSIVVENTQEPNWFTEKLLDCFATGVIPIYWGCPNINRFFDPGGILSFNTMEELHKILSYLSPDLYNSMRSHVLNNFMLFERFASPDKWMLDNCYKELA